MTDADRIASEASPPALELNERPQAKAPASAAGSNTSNANEDSISTNTTTTDIFSQSGKSFSAGTESKQHKLGLDINYPWGWSGSSYDDYDVVTVHGIRDDYKTAWTDKKGAWWVKDVLFKNLSIREVDYSYEIDENSTLYEPDGLILHAEKLITEYAKVRRMLEEIFLDTPHRLQSKDDLEDQLHKLILLPGPEIKNRVFSKVKNLARQVNKVNQYFLATKLLDRAAIFNIFTHNVRDSLRQNHVDENAADSTDFRDKDDLPNPVTPFPGYAHFTGQSFEATGRFRLGDIDHVDLVRCETDDDYDWLSSVSDMFNVSGCVIKVNYRIIQFQAHLLALAPPTRTLDTPFDPTLPEPPVVRWIYEQEAFTSFSKWGIGSRLMHLHGDGDSFVDISEVSRLFYASYNNSILVKSGRRPDETIVYFEFDQLDSRYNTLSSMLTHLINVISWHFMLHCNMVIEQELTFLNDTRSWSFEDLYHLYTAFRWYARTHQLVIFIGCFDQCPKDERQWFLERVLEEQSYNEERYCMIMSTSTRDGLVADSFPDKARINLGNCPAIGESSGRLTEEFRLGLVGLMERRPIYKNFRPQLESLLEECGTSPYLGHIILTWLGKYHRGKPKSQVADKINNISPVTAQNIVQVFISSLAPWLQPRAKNVFNWVKHASEPWSPESLVEALAVYESRDEEPSFNDLDVEGTMSDIEEVFGGIIIVKNRDVKFSHPSFYHVPELGIEGSAEERAAKVNCAMAETCLRYFQFKDTRETLAEFSPENLEGGPWETPLDAAVVSNTRTSMAEYAVRFWSQHYKASGQFKPSKLVHRLFASKEARASWEVPFWLLSNPFTRIQRSYISTLPALVMLGLEDLVDEKVKSEKDQPSWGKDCWFAITEAVRAGNKKIVQQLLEQVRVDEEELRTALFWAAAQGNGDILNVLVEKIPNLETFQWPENIVYRAAAAGLDSLLVATLLSGCDINKTSGYWGAPSVLIATWRNRVSTMELLLNSEPKPDLTIRYVDGDTAVIAAAATGNPRLIELLLQAGASLDVRKDNGLGPVQMAILSGRPKALDTLIKAGADFESSKKEHDASPWLRPPIVIAADAGFRECVCVLLNHKADPNVECATGTALYRAVAGNHADVAQLLLEHEPKPDMEVTPSDQEMLLIRAVCTGNTELVSLLIKHGAKVDFVDPNGAFCKTPLSRACMEGNLEMVKLLLKNKADINYTGGASDTPLFTAFYENQFKVAKYLLQDENVDVKWTANDGMGLLHAAINEPSIIPELLKRGVPIDGHSLHGTALHIAARDGYSESVKALLENDPKPDLDSVYGDDGYNLSEIGCTPLQLACMHLRRECVKLLLEAGANPKYKNKNGDDAADILLRTESDSEDARECLKLLLSKPYKVPVDHVNEQGQTRLHNIRENTPVSIVRLLVEAKAPFDDQDLDGYTPLAVAISKGNEGVAKYFIEQGASLNAFGPGFGSILHLAVTNGALDLVKLLINSGTDCEMVDPEYGESLLYTALGIRDDSKLTRMVRYLVDEVKVPVNKLGGQLGYPIIRAADMTRTNHTMGTKMLKFLIRRKAQLNVTDGQGRRAVYLACTSSYDGGIKALVEAGAEIDVKDKFGRMPIHFAASSPRDKCIGYILDKFKDTDVSVADHDNWTPLLWAARSGDGGTIVNLIARGANVWVRGRAYDARAEWSALKLMNFANNCTWLRGELEPKERTRVNPDGEKEEWDDYFHKIRTGHHKDASCKSCLARIIGIQWKCIECTDFSLCFKCYGYRSDIHNSEHSFEEIGPLYDQRLTSSPQTSTSSDNVAQESPQGASGYEREGKEQDVTDSDDEILDEIELDLDDFD
ncbi:hypothetical protein DL768_003490 [Monosporascus sp. mg162]|nr:hypothetical protein DL768_003490 [Monosporascus sp. mg162]